MLEGRPPARLRHSWEARCRLVRLVLSGKSPRAASMVCGMSRPTASRLLGRYQRRVRGAGGSTADRHAIGQMDTQTASPYDHRRLIVMQSVLAAIGSADLTRRRGGVEAVEQPW
jgi:hypothetical protein